MTFFLLYIEKDAQKFFFPFKNTFFILTWAEAFFSAEMYKDLCRLEGFQLFTWWFFKGEAVAHACLTTKISSLSLMIECEKNSCRGVCVSCHYEMFRYFTRIYNFFFIFFFLSKIKWSFCLPLNVNYGFSHLYLVCFSINIKIFIGFHSACFRGDGERARECEDVSFSRDKKNGNFSIKAFHSRARRRRSTEENWFFFTFFLFTSRRVNKFLFFANFFSFDNLFNNKF